MAIRSARAPAAIVLVLAAIAGCSGAASGSGNPSVTPSPEPAATSTAGGASGPSPADTAIAGPLEDLIPDEVGGIKLAKRIVHGPDIGELDPEEAANIAKVLEKVDGPLEAFAVVTATGTGITLSAWRMEGTDGRQLGESFVAFVVGLGDAKVEDITIGEKEVKRVTPAGTTPLHIYVTGEVMFVVQAKDPKLVAEALALLP